MKSKLGAIAIAFASLASLFAPASAAIMSSADADPTTPDISVDSIILSITGSFNASQPINYSEAFLAGPLTAGAMVDVGIINSVGAPAGFDNLVLTISSAAGDFAYQLTSDVMSGAGVQLTYILNTFLAPGQTFLVGLTGDAVTRGTSMAFLSLNFTAIETPEVPVPAAAPLILSGLAGLLFAGRRRKQVGGATA